MAFLMHNHITFYYTQSTLMIVVFLPRVWFSTSLQKFTTGHLNHTLFVVASFDRTACKCVLSSS